jgi:hypothetical protein
MEQDAYPQEQRDEIPMYYRKGSSQYLPFSRSFADFGQVKAAETQRTGKQIHQQLS